VSFNELEARSVPKNMWGSPGNDNGVDTGALGRQLVGLQALPTR
jgi:hypothetical protein